MLWTLFFAWFEVNQRLDKQRVYIERVTFDVNIKIKNDREREREGNRGNHYQFCVYMEQKGSKVVPNVWKKMCLQLKMIFKNKSIPRMFNWCEMWIVNSSTENLKEIGSKSARKKNTRILSFHWIMTNRNLKIKCVIHIFCYCQTNLKNNNHANNLI